MPRLEDFADLGSVLASGLAQERWFADKHRAIVGFEIGEAFWLEREVPGLLVVLAEVAFAEGPATTYQLLLGMRPWDRHLPAALRAAARRAQLRTEGGASWALYDAFLDPHLASAYLQALDRGAELKGEHGGRLRFRLLHPPLPPLVHLEPVPPAGRDQSQTSILFGDQLLLKVVRRVWPGLSPEAELLEALDGAGFAGIARPLGVVECRRDGTASSLAIAQSYLHNGTDGFSLALTSLRDLYGDLSVDADGAVPLPGDSLQAVQTQRASFTGSASQIGVLTADLHLALAGLRGDPDLEPRPMTRDDLQAVADDLESFLERLLGLDDPRLETLSVHADALRQLARSVVHLPASGLVIRIHGDYHLGQLLRTDAGWYALDFEGRPSLAVKARRKKTTALQDIAGMLRSFDYAATVALRQQADEATRTSASLAPYGRAWASQARDAFLSHYLERVSGSGIVPEDPEASRTLLDCLQVSQALYEVDYELRSRPDWVAIPLEGMARLLTAEEQRL